MPRVSFCCKGKKGPLKYLVEKEKERDLFQENRKFRLKEQGKKGELPHNLGKKNGNPPVLVQENTNAERGKRKHSNLNIGKRQLYKPG